MPAPLGTCEYRPIVVPSMCILVPAIIGVVVPMQTAPPKVVCKINVAGLPVLEFRACIEATLLYGALDKAPIPSSMLVAVLRKMAV